VQGVTYRVQAVAQSDKVEYPVVPEREGGGAPEPKRTITIRYLTDSELSAGEYERAELRAGDEIPGPAVIREPLSTTFLVPGQVARVGTYGELRIRKA
jgi:N-methylhydantoinase A